MKILLNSLFNNISIFNEDPNKKKLAYYLFSRLILSEVSNNELNDTQISNFFKQLEIKDIDLNKEKCINFDRTTLKNYPEYKEKLEKEEIILDISYLNKLVNKIEQFGKSDEKLIDQTLFDINEISGLKELFIKIIDKRNIHKSNFLDDIYTKCQNILNNQDKESFNLNKKLTNRLINTINVNSKVIVEFLNNNVIKSYLFHIPEINIKSILEHSGKSLDYKDRIFQDFIPITISKKNYNTIKDLFNEIKAYKSISLNGIESSGKTFLGIGLCIEALENGYKPLYLDCSNINNTEIIDNKVKFFIEMYQDKLFIYLDNLNQKLNIKSSSIKFVLKFINDKISSNSILMVSQNSKKDLYSFKVEDFNIEKPVSTSEKWIKNILDEILYRELKIKVNDLYSLYEKYISKKIQEEIDTKKFIYGYSELRELFSKISFNYLLSNDIRLSDLNLTLEQKEELRKNNSLFSIEQYSENIVFSQKIFAVILSIDYIFEKISIEEVDLLKELDLKSPEYQSLMYFIAYRLNNINKKILKKHTFLIDPILYQLRQLKEFNYNEKVINFISDKDLKNNELRKFYLEKAKNLYLIYGNYKESIEYALKAVNSNDDDINSDINNHISSCLVDLFFPKSTIKFLENYTDDKIINENPKILGNLARAYLKDNNFIKSRELFIKKSEIHQKLGKEKEYYRDLSDIILLNSFAYRINKDENLLHNSIKLLNKIIFAYEKIEDEELIPLDRNKLYAYRNLSFFLPVLTIKQSNLIFEKINEIDKLKTINYLGIINLNKGIFYGLNNDSESSKQFLIESIEKLDTYKAELYLTYSYLYHFTKEDKYLKQAENYYDSLKNEADRTFTLLNTNLLKYNDSFSLLWTTDIEKLLTLMIF